MSPTGWLIVFLAFVGVQRLAELVLSARNARRALARGGREYGAEHFPWLVLVHVLYIAGLGAEVLLLGTRPGPAWPVWLGLWLAAQALRYASIRALGERWNVRVIVIPGLARVRSGPYRYLRHPNYLAVVSELFAGPMIFGAWRIAVLASLLDAVALRTRIRVEEDALSAAENS
jgi:methyltransferase